MKRCPHCKQTLPLTDFRTADRRWLCRPCERVYMSAAKRRQVRRQRGLPEDAVIRNGPPPSLTLVGEDGLRACNDCKQRLPLTSFGGWASEGRRYYRTYCRPCESKRRAVSDARQRQLRREETERRGIRGCSRCHRMLALAMFDKRIDPQDGALWYTPQCKECDPSNGTKRCMQCGDELPLSRFEEYYDATYGKTRRRGRCSRCWSNTNSPWKAARRAESQGRPVAQRKPARPKPVREAPTYPCTNACGAVVSGAAKMCRECKIAQFDDSHARDTTKLIRQSTKRILRDYEQGLIKGLIWIAPDEVWSANAQCNKCGKPIMSQAYRCYTCATGRQRTVLRLDERAAAAA